MVTLIGDSATQRSGTDIAARMLKWFDWGGRQKQRVNRQCGEYTQGVVYSHWSPQPKVRNAISYSRLKSVASAMESWQTCKKKAGKTLSTARIGRSLDGCVHKGCMIMETRQHRISRADKSVASSKSFEPASPCHQGMQLRDGRHQASYALKQDSDIWA